MILDLPIPPSWLRLVTTNAADASASGDASSPNGVDAPSAPAADPSESPGAQSDPEEVSAQYFSQQSPHGEPCLLMVSPLLPLPSSLVTLVRSAIQDEADFKLDWKWPPQTPRLGPWEVVAQLCIGQSRESGLPTGRLYVALDAGVGAFLIVVIDRDPNRLAQRQAEVFGLLSRAQLFRVQHAGEAEGLQPPNNNLAASEPAGPDLLPSRLQAVIPPQQPAPELYLKEFLFRHFVD